MGDVVVAAGSRSRLIANRPAHIVIAYLGHPGTTGMFPWAACLLPTRAHGCDKITSLVHAAGVATPHRPALWMPGLRSIDYALVDSMTTPPEGEVTSPSWDSGANCVLTATGGGSVIYQGHPA